MRRPLVTFGVLVMGGLLAVAWRRAAQGDPRAPGALNARTFVDDGVPYRYQIFLPRNYDPAKRWPVVVALHGSREKGTDGTRQIGSGLAPVVLEQARTFPAVVVFPQVHPGESAARSIAVLRGLVDDAMRDVNGDPRRLYLTGLSFGGIIAYDLVLAEPSRYAAVVPVATHPIVNRADGVSRLPDHEADAALARALRATPVWLVHGANDGAVPVDRTRRLLAALRAAGVRVSYTEYPDGGHEIWDRAYRSPELWRWLFAQRR